MSSERDLTRRAAEGDREAGWRLIEPHLRVLFVTAHALTGSRETSEELVQDVCTEALSSLGRYDSAKPIRPWLIGILKRLVLRRRRQAARRARAMKAAAEDVARRQAPEEGADALESHETQLLIRDELFALPDDLRVPLVLFYFEDRSTSAVAESLGIRPAAARKRLQRARDRLRDNLLSRLAAYVGTLEPPSDLKARVAGQLETCSAETAAGAGGASTVLGGTAAATGGLLMAMKKLTIIVIALTAALLVPIVWLAGDLGESRHAVDRGPGWEELAVSPADRAEPEAISERPEAIASFREGDSETSVRLFEASAATIVRGQVVNAADGEPLEGAELAVTRVEPDGEPPERIEKIVSDGTGRFELRGLEPAKYRLRAVGDDRRSLTGSAEVDLEGSGERTVLLSVDVRYWIAGIVVEAGSSRPVPRLQLRLGIDAGDRRPLARTGADGRFRSDEPHEVGRALITTLDRARLDVLAVRNTTLADIAIGAEQDLIDLRLEHPWNGHVVGRVIDSSDRPLAQAEVFIIPLEEELLNWSLLGQRPGSLGITTRDGRFDIGFLPTDVPLRAAAKADGFAPALGEPLQAAREGEGEEIVLVLQRPGRITGRVLLPDGEPAVRARIRARGFPAGPSPGEAHTDEEGRFELRDVPPGGYVLSAELPPYEMPNATFHEAVQEDGSIRYTSGRLVYVEVVEDEEAFAEIRLIQQDERRSITGRVVDEEGRPVPNARVVAERLASDPAKASSHPTRGDGLFEITGLAPGRYRLTPFLRLGSEGGQPLNAEAGAQDLVLVHPVQRGERRLQVRDEKGAPIAGSWLRLQGSFESLLSVLANESAGIDLELPVGRYPLIVWARGFAPHRGSFELAEGENDPVEVRLSPGRTQRGRVLHAHSGLPIEGARVVVVEPIRNPQAWLGLASTAGVTDAEGRFTLDSLPLRGGHVGLLDERNELIDASVVAAEGLEVVIHSR